MSSLSQDIYRFLGNMARSAVYVRRSAFLNYLKEKLTLIQITSEMNIFGNLCDTLWDSLRRGEPLENRITTVVGRTTEEPKHTQFPVASSIFKES